MKVRHLERKDVNTGAFCDVQGHRRTIAGGQSSIPPKNRSYVYACFGSSIGGRNKYPSGCGYMDVSFLLLAGCKGQIIALATVQPRDFLRHIEVTAYRSPRNLAWRL